MKKVLVGFLVIASSVFAGTLNVRIDGPGDLVTGEYATLDIVLEANDGEGALFSGGMLMHVVGTAELEISSMTWGDDFVDATLYPVPSTMLEAEGYCPKFFGPYRSLAEDTVVLSIDVFVVHPGYLSVDLYPHNVPQSAYGGLETNFVDGYGEPFGGTTTPWLMPEPGSLVLLAIGGLAIFRRR